MNRVMTAALAGLIATATIATTVAPAAAGGGYGQPYWKKGPGYGGPGYGGPGYGPKPWGPPPGHWHGGGGGGNWGAAGAIVGLALGAVIASQPPPPPRYYAPPPPPPYPYYPAQPVYAQPAYPSLSQAHVDWCAATYPNYQPASDTYLAANGVYYRCVGPY